MRTFGPRLPSTLNEVAGISFNVIRFRKGLLPLGPSLSMALDNPANSFNFVRLLAAVMVIVSHSFFILLDGNRSEPLSWAAYDLGATAVNIFFVLSGMMVSRSFALRPNLARFLRARVLRIYPALLMAGVVTTVAIGPIGADVPVWRYFTDPANWLYPLQVAYDFAGADLPAFSHEMRHETNASLWTIKFELIAYVSFAILAVLGWAGSRLILSVVLAISAVAVTLGIGVDAESENAVASLARFAFAFTLGMLAFELRHRISLSPALAFIAVAAALSLSLVPGASVWSILAFGYAAWVLGGTTLRQAWAWTQRADISFGLYLYGWPVQQALVHVFNWSEGLIPAHIATSLLLAGSLAWFSWAAVERPALRWKG